MSQKLSAAGAPPAPARSAALTAAAAWQALPRLLLALAVAAYGAFFCILTFSRYRAFEASAMDLGNLNQTIWNIAHGNWFHLTNQPGIVNRLSLHVEPILLPIAALYRLYPQPELLLALQAVTVALGAVPIFALARRQLRSEWAALPFALVYLLFPALQGALWFDFHPVTLAPAFLAAAFYFLVARRLGWYLLFAVLAASCKEEMALLVSLLGLYAWLVRKERRWGLWTMALSLAWALIAVFAIQGYFGAGNIHWDRYAHLGESPAEILRTLLTQPGTVRAHLRDADAWGYSEALFAPVAFLALLAPEVLLIAAPSIALNLLSAYPATRSVYELHYAAPIVPFIVMAAVMGLAHTRRHMERSIPQHPSFRRRAAVWLALCTTVMLSCALWDQRQHGYLPGSANYLLFPVTPRHELADSLAAQIAPDAAVSAQDPLNPRVSGRKTLYIFPRIEDADTVFVDAAGRPWPQHPNDVFADVRTLLASGFGVDAADNGYLILRRGAPEKEFPSQFYSVWTSAAPPWPGMGPTTPLAADFADQLRLTGYRVGVDARGEMVVELDWQALQPLAGDLYFYIAYLDENGAALHDSRYYQPTAALWYPTSRWEPHTTVRVRSLPWTLEEDRFTLAVGLFRSPDGWDAGDRLPVTAVQPALPLLEGGALLRLGSVTLDASGNWTPLSPQPAPPAVTLDARFGDALRLQGVTAAGGAPQAGRPLDFTLHWQTAAPLPFDYSIFAHLLDAKGETVAQLDWQPRDSAGLLPMTAWLPQQPVPDSQTLALPENLPPGVYRLVVGVYNWQTNARLPVSGDDAEPGDVVTVASFELR